MSISKYAIVHQKSGAVFWGEKEMMSLSIQMTSCLLDVLGSLGRGGKEGEGRGGGAMLWGTW